MSTNTFADLEVRLRDDLPRLAGELTSAQVDELTADDDLRRLEPVAVSRTARRWLVPLAAVAAVALLVIAVVVLRPDHRRDLGPVDVGPAPVDAGWAPMATSPLSPREAAVSVWTGTEVIIWGGRIGNQALLDGAAYNPTSDTWRMITPNTWGHPGATGVWTGTEMVVLAKNGGAAYDPATDTWRDLPRVDGGGGFIAPVWTGSELLGLGFESDESGLDQRLIASSLVGDHWSTGGTIAVGAGASSVGHRITWTGSAVVVSDGVGGWWSYDPDTTEWSSLPPLTMTGAELIEAVPAVLAGTVNAVAWLNVNGVSTLRVARLHGAGWAWVGDGTSGQLEPKNASPAVDVGARLIVLGYGAPPWSVDVETGAIEDASDRGFGELGNSTVASTGTEVVVWGGIDPAGRATAAGWRWRPGG